MSATAVMPDATFQVGSWFFSSGRNRQGVIGVANMVDEELGSARWHRQGGQIGAALKWGDDLEVSRG